MFSCPLQRPMFSAKPVILSSSCSFLCVLPLLLFNHTSQRGIHPQTRGARGGGLHQLYQRKKKNLGPEHPPSSSPSFVSCALSCCSSFLSSVEKKFFFFFPAFCVQGSFLYLRKWVFGCVPDGTFRPRCSALAMSKTFPVFMIVNGEDAGDGIA